MTDHEFGIPPWEKLTHEQLVGAKFAARYLRTSVLVRGRALELVDGLIMEIATEMNKSKSSPYKCPRDTCPPSCKKWADCRGKDGRCPLPRTCWCSQICEYAKSSKKGE